MVLHLNFVQYTCHVCRTLQVYVQVQFEDHGQPLVWHDHFYCNVVISLELCGCYSAANSINWARLLAQMVYHISGYLDLVAQNLIHMGQEIDIAVPTGNFGNILSAVYARVRTQFLFYVLNYFSGNTFYFQCIIDCDDEQNFNFFRAETM